MSNMYWASAGFMLSASAGCRAETEAVSSETIVGIAWDIKATRPVELQLIEGMAPLRPLSWKDDALLWRTTEAEGMIGGIFRATDGQGSDRTTVKFDVTKSYLVGWSTRPFIAFVRIFYGETAPA